MVIFFIFKYLFNYIILCLSYILYQTTYFKTHPTSPPKISDIHQYIYHIFKKSKNIDLIFSFYFKKI